MAYGITNPNQLIDIETIRAGCQALADAVNDFETCGGYVLEAGETCSKKALSVDSSSLDGQITEVAEQIMQLKDAYVQCAEELLQDAIRVYNQQVNEYNEYIRRKNEEAKRNQSNKR